MNSNISAWSIRHPVPVIVLFLVLSISGITSFFALSINDTPNIDVPWVSVTVGMPGAAPSELELQVTRIIEDAVSTVGNVKSIKSTVSEGSSSTQIEFFLGTSTEKAVNDVRNAIAKTRQELPQDIIEPLVQREDIVGGPLAAYVVESPVLSVEQLSWLVETQISKALLTVPGVAKVQRSGCVTREVRVNLDPTRLKALGTTADMVSKQLRAVNANLPGGRGAVGAAEQSIRTLGSAPTIKDLAAEEIMLADGRYTRLDTLGTVADGMADLREMALLDGKPVVSFEIVRASGSNLVDVEKAVDARIRELQKRLTKGTSIRKIYTNGDYVRMSYDASVEAVVFGALLALIVIWLFLRDMRATTIAALAMPLSIIPTFAALKWAGFTLNGMSLLGFALVVGILVDDAIVEIENIVRHIKMGKTPFQAALDASDEIGLAVVATTMTIIVVFLPVAFMGGIPGQFFKQFGLTVACAVFCSLVVARMMTPLMAAYWMKTARGGTSKGWMLSVYESTLRWAIGRRALAVGIAVAFFIGSLGLFKLIPTSLWDPVDHGETDVSVELPPGSRIEDCAEVVRQVTRILHQRKEVKTVFATINPTSAWVFATLVPRSQRNLSQKQIEDIVRPQFKSIPGARVRFGFAGGPGMFSLILTGDNAESVTRAADEIGSGMRKLPQFHDVHLSTASLRPEIQIRPDFARAAEQGVSVQSIAHTAMIATLGDIEANLPRFDLADRQLKIRVQLDPKYRNDLDTLRNLNVMSARGELVPLANVAEVDIGSGPSQIDRFDRCRQVTIEASLDSKYTLGQALDAVHQLPAFKHMSEGVREKATGEAEIHADIFSGFASAIQYAIVLIYAVLVLLFGSFLHPVTIMIALPLSLGGAMLGLILFGKSLGMYALIGIVMLMGLVTKNSILLVEYALMAMRQGASSRKAISQAGEARMRPILMTTVAMIGGMLPVALGIGAGSEARAPMAIAVIGGLITSTALTLLVVPVVFTYVHDFQQWFKRRVQRRSARLQLGRPGEICENICASGVGSRADEV